MVWEYVDRGCSLIPTARSSCRAHEMIHNKFCCFLQIIVLIEMFTEAPSCQPQVFETDAFQSSICVDLKSPEALAKKLCHQVQAG